MSAMRPMNEVRQAATVVLLRERNGSLETLLLRRNAAVQFAGGLWVFPGGRIDAADFAADANDILAAAKRAAIRETREETGLAIDDCALHYFAHWTTPDGDTKRYATWFFVTAIAGDNDVLVDGGEIETHLWIAPERALVAHRNGELHMMAPTYISLYELATCNSVQQVEAMYRNRSVIEILPKYTVIEGGGVALYPNDSGYASGDHTLSGRRHRALRRADGWHYQCD